MGSPKLSRSNEVRTCGIATRTIGASLVKPSDARSNPAAEPGDGWRPDEAGEARVRASRDPAEGRERARKGDSGPKSFANRDDIAGDPISSPAKSHGATPW